MLNGSNHVVQEVKGFVLAYIHVPCMEFLHPLRAATYIIANYELMNCHYVIISYMIV